MTTQRKLATIFAADATGYSRLMGDDDKATVQTLTDYRLVFTDYISRHHGRVIDTAGDSVLAVFDSPVDAVECSIDIQKELARRNRQLAEHRRMDFRIGLNLGDIIVREDGTIYGEGVNIAARLQTIAEPGGICLSASVHDQVETHVQLVYVDIGEQQVKNIAKPVKAYRLFLQITASLESRATRARARRIIVGSAFALVLLAVGGGVWWWKEQGKLLHSETTAHLQTAKPTIAVLPFQNMSGDPQQEYFADGLSEELITLLTQFRDVSVIARNSMFTYKGKAVDVRNVGREMHADFVLEGSVRRAANTVRVTAQLLSAKDGTHLWADTFERNLTAGGLFSLQDEISERVATSIAGNYGIISLARNRETSRKPPEALQSYECILKVYEYNRIQTPDSFTAALTCLERVTSSDPQYADAWAWLAMMYIDEYSLFGKGKASIQLEKGREAVRKAVHIDPSNPIAATMEAYCLYFKKDPTFFEKAHKAVVANPRDFYTLAQMGQAVSWAGQWKDGRALLDRAIAISPRPPGWVYLPISHRAFLDGNYRQGLEFALKVDMAGWHWHHVAVAPNYARLGMKKEAQAEIALLQKAYPDFENHAYEEFRRWMWKEGEIEELIQGLRDAGMDIPRT